MPYRVINGTFHVFYPDLPRQGPEPDGDTIKIQPDNPSIVEELPRAGRSPDFNGKRMVNLRYEAIDALETHFSDMHQHLEQAYGARDEMLRLAGFRDVKYWDDIPHKVESVGNNPRNGRALSRLVDYFGRPIAFVFSETGPDLRDNHFVDVDTARSSINLQLLEGGFVYPALYSSLPVDLRTEAISIAKTARSRKKGVWAIDTASVESTATIANLSDLQQLAIWPKLFRRLAKFFASGHVGLGGFDEWLRADTKDRDDRLLLLENSEIGNIHDVLEIDSKANTIRMTHWPDEFVILPDDQ